MSRKALTRKEKTAIRSGLYTLSEEAYAIAIDKGWFNENEMRNFGELLALVHSEVSEALEAGRIGNPESEKIPGNSHVSEELADVVIRVLDISEHFSLNVPDAIIAKMEFNRTREARHGGKLF